eukprot:3387665-Pyramimonas_sp.AAC.1
MRGFTCYLGSSEYGRLTAVQGASLIAAGAVGEGLAALLLYPSEMGQPAWAGLWELTVAIDTVVR